VISLHAYIQRGIEHIAKHPELAMTIFLVLFIPASFLVSGQQFLTAARSNQERLELDRIGMMHDVFSAYMTAVDFDTERLQEEIFNLKSDNPDITAFRIAHDEGRDIRIVASLSDAEIGSLAVDADAYRYAYTNPDETFILPYAKGGIRYWQSYKLVEKEGFPTHYLYIETSLEHIDTLFAARIMSAYYWLIVLLVIIIYLLIRHVRLIDYAYLYRETKKANEMKDLFTNMIAHELRAPLTAMRGYASMIRERGTIDDTTRKNAIEIENASGRLVTIVSDLLDIARLQSGKMHIEKTTVHLTGLIHSVVEALKPSADEKNITLKVDDAHRSVEVSADEKRLFQVFTNILSNAIKYTNDGSITISIAEIHERVEVRVKDTGMGISSENQKKMFAPFFRVEGDETASITGTGLGMWVTKQLVELMDGSIGIESIKGIGTHVVVTLPSKALSD
jgi:signal transduction histidine kinase